MIRYHLHGRMSKDSDWHYLCSCWEWELKEKSDHYFKTWRYVRADQLDVGKINERYL